MSGRSFSSHASRCGRRVPMPLMLNVASFSAFFRAIVPSSYRAPGRAQRLSPSPMTWGSNDGPAPPAPAFAPSPFALAGERPPPLESALLPVTHDFRLRPGHIHARDRAHHPVAHLRQRLHDVRLVRAPEGTRL